MAKTALACSKCGHRSFQWLGRCPECEAWDSFQAFHAAPAAADGPAPVSIGDVDASPHRRVSTGLGELDRVLGGGLVKGSVVLIAGEPGVGKSTLTLQAAAGLEASGQSTIIFCGEESLDQVAARARRLGGPTTARVSAATEVSHISSSLAGADVAIVDSVQTLRDPNGSGDAGSVAQVRSCAGALARVAKQSQTAVVLVGHVTKDGAVAGPRSLEHLVDVVLTFEGDRGHQLRTVRGVKNRFGPAGELGVFEMGEAGLKEVADASQLFLGERAHGVSGCAVGCVLEGRRPVALEVQTLVEQTNSQLPRRVVQGIELSRLGMVLAVLHRRAGVSLANHDVYASVAGGLRAAEPGVDLALALALAGSKSNAVLPANLAAVGEVGLGGEIRSVAAMQTRSNELARLGFTQVVAPPAAGCRAHGLYPVEHLRDALKLLQ